MYPLLPWKILSAVLMVVVAVAVFVDDLLGLMGITVPDAMIIRALPVLFLGTLTAIFAPTGYWAPWRFLWRRIPSLNNLFPDLNGIWIGTTNSNWPTIKILVDKAQSSERVTDQELHDTPGQVDAMAVQITNNLFKLKIHAALTSTRAFHV